VSTTSRIVQWRIGDSVVELKYNMYYEIEMGSGLSSTITTHADLFKKTAGTRHVVDDIFTYMMHHLKVNDFMNLSNPEGCNKYVLFMANNLSMFFSKLRVAPHLGKEGVLAFRSIDELEEPKGDALKEKESLCLALAYFYTRIFQIYGAIALTLIDDINYTVDKAALMRSRPSTESVMGSMIPTPGERSVYVEPRTSKGLRQSEWSGGQNDRQNGGQNDRQNGGQNDRQNGGQVGGWVQGLGYFDFLNNGMIVERKSFTPASPFGVPVAQTSTAPTNQYGYTLNYTYKDQNNKAMFFKTESKDAYGRNTAVTTQQKGIFTWVDNQKKIFEMIVLLVFLPRWVILLPVSAC